MIVSFLRQKHGDDVIGCHFADPTVFAMLSRA